MISVSAMACIVSGYAQIEFFKTNLQVPNHKTL